MAGKRFDYQNSKDILQFAPNFTVYALPSDIVCLYSEDRKFFLHGALFSALASTIGRHGRSCRDVVRALAHNFPSNQIEEALKRLIDRRYVVSRPPTGAVAAYWASLGLSLATAERNLQNCRVRIESVHARSAGRA